MKINYSVYSLIQSYLECNNTVVEGVELLKKQKIDDAWFCLHKAFKTLPAHFNNIIINVLRTNSHLSPEQSEWILNQSKSIESQFK